MLTTLSVFLAATCCRAERAPSPHEAAERVEAKRSAAASPLPCKASPCRRKRTRRSQTSRFPKFAAAAAAALPLSWRTEFQDPGLRWARSCATTGCGCRKISVTVEEATRGRLEEVSEVSGGAERVTVAGCPPLGLLHCVCAPLLRPAGYKCLRLPGRGEHKSAQSLAAVPPLPHRHSSFIHCRPFCVATP